MNLIVYQVMQLQIVHVADGYPVFKGFARAAVVQHRLTVRILSGLNKQILYILLARAVEYRRCNVPAQRFCRHAKVQLKYLTYVHSARNAQRVKHYLQRRAIRQEGHILFGQYP